jgi:hypothetical protein
MVSSLVGGDWGLAHEEIPMIGGMKQLVWFVLLGLSFAVPGEILNQILARQNVAAFRSTLVSYAVLLCIGYFVGRGIFAVVKPRRRAALGYYLSFGCLGLTVEWLLLGNAPVWDWLQPITQAGMFTYWGTLLLAPRLMMEPAEFAGLKRSFLTFFVSFSLVYLLVAGMVPRPRGGIFVGFVIFAAGTAGLNYFYIKYFRRL